MTVEAINLNRTEAPLARAKVAELVRAPSVPAGPTPEPAPDRAIVSEQARELSAALAGQRALPKLHLSPQELRALVSPREPASGHW
jgi:hypothetical protein